MAYIPTKTELEILGFIKSKTPFIAAEGGQEKYVFDEYYKWRKWGFMIDCIADSKFHPTIVWRECIERFSLIHDWKWTAVNWIAYTNIYPQSFKELQNFIKLFHRI